MYTTRVETVRHIILNGFRTVAREGFARLKQENVPRAPIIDMRVAMMNAGIWQCPTKSEPGSSRSARSTRYSKEPFSWKRRLWLCTGLRMIVGRLYAPSGQTSKKRRRSWHCVPAMLRSWHTSHANASTGIHSPRGCAAYAVYPRTSPSIRR